MGNPAQGFRKIATTKRVRSGFLDAKAGKRKFDSCVVARVIKMIAAPELLSEFLESETRPTMQPNQPQSAQFECSYKGSTLSYQRHSGLYPIDNWGFPEFDNVSRSTLKL